MAAEMRRNAAKTISYLLSNPIVGGLGGLAIMLKEEAFSSNPVLNVLIVLFFYSMVPFISIYYLRLKGSSDIFMSERARRPKHFLLGLVGYSTSALVFQKWGMGAMVMTSTSFLITSLFLLTLTMVTKVSVHVAGLTCTLALILYFYGHFGLMLLPLMPILAWARVNTREHTYGQTTLGAVVGLLGAMLGIILLRA